MSEAVVVGIDVGMEQVEVAVLGGEGVLPQYANDGTGQAALLSALQPLGVALVVLEATGGYEAALACT